MKTLDEGNIAQWQKFYKRQESYLQYPDENLVRLMHSCGAFTAGNDGGVLDFGCGGGRHLQLLQHFDPIYILDISAPALQKSCAFCPRAIPILYSPTPMHAASKKTQDAQDAQEIQEKQAIQNSKGMQKLTVLRDLSSMIPAASLRLVIAWGVLHYLSPLHQQEVLAQFAAMLSPGGSLLLTLRAHGDTHLQTQSALESVKFQLLSHSDAHALVSSYFPSHASVDLGYIERCPVGQLDRKICHWIVRAQKKDENK